MVAPLALRGKTTSRWQALTGGHLWIEATARDTVRKRLEDRKRRPLKVRVIWWPQGRKAAQ